MVITLTPEQSALVTGLMETKRNASRELDLVLSVLRAGAGPGQFTGVHLEGTMLTFVGDTPVMGGVVVEENGDGA